MHEMVIYPLEGELGRYIATSDTDHDDYMVDLLANSGRGECSCPDWRFRCKKHLDKPINPLLSRQLSACKHIARAQQLFIYEACRLLAKQQNEQ